MPKIAVIIPVFKTERFLERCVRSVMAQTLEDIEIICVDDCSPDGSLAIIERLALEDARIKIIRHDKNLGLGGARNTGIYAANSAYIASVDSDDYVAPQMLEQLWDETENQSIDIIAFGYQRVDESGNPLNVFSPRPRTEINVNHSFNIFKVVNPAFWNKLWRVELYTENNIYFPNHVFFQDLATTPRICAMAKTVKWSSCIPYNYVSHNQSVTNTISPKHLIDFLTVFEVLELFLRKENLWDRYRNEYIDAVGNAIKYHARNVIQSNMNLSEKSDYLRKLLLIRSTIIRDLSDVIGRDYEDICESLMMSSESKDKAIKAALRYKIYRAAISPFLDEVAKEKLDRKPSRFFLDATHPVTKLGRRLHRSILN